MLAIFMALGISFDFLPAPSAHFSPIEAQLFYYHFPYEKAIFQTANRKFTIPNILLGASFEASKHAMSARQSRRGRIVLAPIQTFRHSRQASDSS
jgi:hypothetical protein